jgi:hypothetical protein
MEVISLALGADMINELRDQASYRGITVDTFVSHLLNNSLGNSDIEMPKVPKSEYGENTLS